MLNKDINLLKNSQITKDHLILRRTIKENPRLDDKEIHLLSKKDRYFFRDIYPQVKRRAIGEWTVEKNSAEYDPKGKMKCQLCGQKIKNICIIKNNFNEKRLKVGTECVKEFGILSDFNFEKQLEEKKRIKRLENLNSIFPGIERELNEWNLFIDSQEILISNEIKSRYLELETCAKDIFNEYLDKNTLQKNRPKLIKDMEDILRNKGHQMDKIKQYTLINKDNPLIPSRELISRLKTVGQWDVIGLLQEDGIIRHRTLFRIRDKEFSKTLINPYNKKMKKFDCTIDGVTEYKNRLGYEITYKRKNRIKLFCSHYNLCLEYYNFITNDLGDDITFNGLIEICEIYGESSMESIIYELFQLISNSHFKIHENIYYEYDEIYIYNQEDRFYYELSINRIIQRFKMDLFTGNKQLNKKFHDYISLSCVRAISREDMEHIDENRLSIAMG